MPPAVALEFLLNTSGRMGRKEFMWTVQHVMAIQLSPKLVCCGGAVLRMLCCAVLRGHEMHRQCSLSS